jgi:hypothetical protein
MLHSSSGSHRSQTPGAVTRRFCPAVGLSSAIVVRVVAMMLGSVQAGAQAGAPAAGRTPPTFAGTWTLAAAGTETQRVTVVAESGDAAFRVGDMGTGWGTTLTLTQPEGRLVLEYPYFSAYDLMAPLHFEFALDGRETLQSVIIGPGVTTLRSRTEWKGDTLLIITRQAVPREVGASGVEAEVRRALVLLSPDSLSITTTRVGVNGAPANTVRSTFSRKR